MKHVGTVRRPEANGEIKGKGHETVNRLCFKCINATGGCEWADNFQPVPGWKTAPGKYPGWVQILECPKFEEGDRVWSKSKASNHNARES